MQQTEQGDNRPALEKFGSDLFPQSDNYEKEKLAINFCKDFAEERKWCYINQIDIRMLPEEIQFQQFVKDFKFAERKAQIQFELQARYLNFIHSNDLKKKQLKSKVVKKMYTDKDYDASRIIKIRNDIN